MIYDLLLRILILVVLGFIILFATYTCIVFVTKQVKKISTEEATNSVNKFFSDLLNTASVTQTAFDVQNSFPVYIGFNGYDMRHDLVDRYFHKLSKYWITFYFDTLITSHPNVIVYQFRVYEPIHPEIPPRRLRSLVQNVSEEVLATYMHEWNTYIPVDRFVAVRIQNDMLQVAIAKNEAGFENIKHMRRF